MRVSRIVALSAFFVGSLASVAHAEETDAKPAKAPTVIKLVIKGRRAIPMSLDVSRLVMKAPLPDLKKPLVDPSVGVDRDPF
jgi:hypothetical protein